MPLRAQPLGAIFVLSLVWLVFEIGRPPTPPAVPMLITVALLIHYLGLKQRQWARHSAWWFAVLASLFVGIPLAVNTFSVVLNARMLALLFLGMCLPLQALINSPRRLRVWIYALIGVAFYVGAWAMTHYGYGPDGQDENYTAALMSAGVGLAYFSLMAERRMLVKVLLVLAMCVFVGGIALAGDPSRGGFIALCAVALYGLYRAPKKGAGLAAIGVMGLALMVFAGPRFWKEIDTTTDYEDGTGDVRLEIWKCGLRMWQANPIFGVGAGNFMWVIQDYQTEEQYAKFGRSLGGSIVAHSTFVELAAELGTVGILGFAMLVWGTWKGLGKVVVKRRPGQALDPALHEMSCYADAIRAALLAFLVSGAFLSLLYYSHIWLMLAVGSAVPFVHARVLQARQGMVPAPLPLAGAMPQAPGPRPVPQLPIALTPPVPGRRA